MDEITPELATNAIVAIEQRGAEDVARRALQTTDQIFRWARSKGRTSHNPASACKPKDILKPMQRKNFKRVDRRDLPELMRKIHFYNGSPITRLAMKLMALVFLRTSKMIEGQWSEIDFKEARWDIPAERMKGPKGKSGLTLCLCLGRLLRCLTNSGITPRTTSTYSPANRVPRT